MKPINQVLKQWILVTLYSVFACSLLIAMESEPQELKYHKKGEGIKIYTASEVYKDIINELMLEDLDNLDEETKEDDAIIQCLENLENIKKGKPLINCLADNYLTYFQEHYYPSIAHLGCNHFLRNEKIPTHFEGAKINDHCQTCYSRAILKYAIENKSYILISPELKKASASGINFNDLTSSTPYIAITDNANDTKNIFETSELTNVTTLPVLIVAGDHGNTNSIFGKNSKWWAMNVIEPLEKKLKFEFIALEACLTAQSMMPFIDLLTDDGIMVVSVTSAGATPISEEITQKKTFNPIKCLQEVIRRGVFDNYAQFLKLPPHVLKNYADQKFGENAWKNIFKGKIVEKWLKIKPLLEQNFTDMKIEDSKKLLIAIVTFFSDIEVKKIIKKNLDDEKQTIILDKITLFNKIIEEIQQLEGKKSTITSLTRNLNDDIFTLSIALEIKLNSEISKEIGQINIFDQQVLKILIATKKVKAFYQYLPISYAIYDKKTNMLYYDASLNQDISNYLEGNSKLKSELEGTLEILKEAKITCTPQEDFYDFIAQILKDRVPKINFPK